MSECNCKICIDHKRWYAALNPQTPEAKAAFDDMLTEIEGASTDASVWRCIFEGNWPSAEQQLTGALERIRAKAGVENG